MSWALLVDAAEAGVAFRHVEHRLRRGDAVDLPTAELRRAHVMTVHAIGAANAVLAELRRQMTERGETRWTVDAAMARRATRQGDDR